MTDEAEVEVESGPTLDVRMKAPSGVSQTVTVHLGETILYHGGDGHPWLRVGFDEDGVLLTLLMMPTTVAPATLRSWADFIEQEQLEEERQPPSEDAALTLIETPLGAES